MGYSGMGVHEDRLFARPCPTHILAQLHFSHPRHLKQSKVRSFLSVTLRYLQRPLALCNKSFAISAEFHISRQCPKGGVKHCQATLAAAARALLLLALLRFGACLHRCSSSTGRDHKALTGHVRHGMSFLGRRMAIRVGTNDKTRWKSLARRKPLALGVVQAAHGHGRHGRHVG